jgi:hypothetical protein
VVVQSVPWPSFLFSITFGAVIAQSGELIAVGKVPASTASLTLRHAFEPRVVCALCLLVKDGVACTAMATRTHA